MLCIQRTAYPHAVCTQKFMSLFMAQLFSFTMSSNSFVCLLVSACICAVCSVLVCCVVLHRNAELRVFCVPVYLFPSSTWDDSECTMNS
eukprot:m.4114 g.4114  ORF g.4114 m.4114 type:complete len:89 (+) comp4421_c0_seq1:911-1177(+)